LDEPRIFPFGEPPWLHSLVLGDFYFLSTIVRVFKLFGAKNIQEQQKKEDT